MLNVEVAVVPAAGRGTRMLPVTRTVPKAFVPVLDRPALQHTVEEAAAAGAQEVVVIVDPGFAELVPRHFEEPLRGIEHVDVRAIVQEQARGLGDAVLMARSAVGDRPFFCLLVDNLPLPGRSVLEGMAEASDGRSVVCLHGLPDEVLTKKGAVATGAWLTETAVEVVDAVEKPAPGTAPSNLALIGRYLFTAEIFDALADLGPGYGGEVQLTDAIARLAREGRCLGLVTEDDLLDVGTPLGLAKAKAILAVADPDWGEEYLAFLEELVASSRP